MNARYIDLKNGQFIITDPKATNAPILQRLAEGRAFLVNAHDLPETAEVDVATVAGQLRELKAEVNSQFVGRGDMVHMTALALIGGDHAFTLSAPGTGKSRIYRLFAEGINGTFFTTNMAKDTTREMVFGPPSMSAIREDRWDRMWSGLATSHLALLDEIWEANSSVTTILKTALEERIVEEAGTRRRIPLLSAFAASNFIPDEKRQGADWDRWLYRLPVDYISSAAGMRELALAQAGTVPVQTQIQPEDMLALNGFVDWMGFNPGEDLVNAWVSLWEEIRTEGYLVSDRRWKRLLRSAQAEAVLQGDSVVAGKHLAVARWMFWDTPEQYKPLSKLIIGLTDPIATEVLDVEKLAEALRDRAASLGQLEWKQRAKVGTAASKLLAKVEEVEAKGNGTYTDRLQPIKDLCQKVEADIVSAWRESGGS